MEEKEEEEEVVDEADEHSRSRRLEDEPGGVILMGVEESEGEPVTSGIELEDGSSIGPVASAPASSDQSIAGSLELVKGR